MASMHSLDIYKSYNCDEAYRTASVVKQCNLKAIYGDDCFDAIGKLITAKIAKVYIYGLIFSFKF